VSKPKAALINLRITIRLRDFANCCQKYYLRANTGKEQTFTWSRWFCRCRRPTNSCWGTAKCKQVTKAPKYSRILWESILACCRRPTTRSCKWAGSLPIFLNRITSLRVSCLWHFITPRFLALIYRWESRWRWIESLLEPWRVRIDRCASSWWSWRDSLTTKTKE